jgi:hypothetical protein
MNILSIVGEAAGTIIGSLAAAAILCWLCWALFKLVHHPEWGAPTLLTMIALNCGSSVLHSEFLSMTFIFSALAAALAWPEGRAWRADRARRRSNSYPGAAMWK